MLRTLVPSVYLYISERSIESVGLNILVFCSAHGAAATVHAEYAQYGTVVTRNRTLQ
jgi:hypothetical protein